MFIGIFETFFPVPSSITDLNNFFTLIVLFLLLFHFFFGESLFHKLKLFLFLISSIPYGITGIPFPHNAPKEPTVSNKENEETPNAIEGLSEIFDIIPSFFA